MAVEPLSRKLMCTTAHIFRPDNFQNHDGAHGETAALDNEGGCIFTCVISNYNANFPLSFFLSSKGSPT